MSATPWVTVNDTWLFCIATGREFNGEPLTRESFPAFARTIAARAGAKLDRLQGHLRHRSLQMSARYIERQGAWIDHPAFLIAA